MNMYRIGGLSSFFAAGTDFNSFPRAKLGRMVSNAIEN